MAQPNVGDRELELVGQAIRSDVLAMGPFTAQFEAGIAQLTGRRHAVACSSGTAGLHMAVAALGIGDGDEVITTPFSFVASANCLLYERAVPRFVDIEEDSLGLDPALVASVPRGAVKALLPVHVFGRPCRIAELSSVALERDWRVIEDACEGLGSSTGDRPLGSFGDASVFAFYPNKQITT
ncbi:MAG TPA: DegT/DnrJ/EryC1/StrS family aminotransferase, partial [Candidatus Limnocylindrales bacterium]